LDVVHVVFILGFSNVSVAFRAVVSRDMGISLRLSCMYRAVNDSFGIEKYAHPVA
jgi:hypothetical protein